MKDVRSAAGDVLLGRAESRRVATLQALPPDQQSALGQFFTPQRAAELIASMVTLPHSGILRVLDPGAGTGSLTAALVARVMREAPDVELDIVAVELDEDIALVLKETLVDLEQSAANVGVTVRWHLVIGDFIERSTGLREFDASLERDFDLVIMNPPYRKLALSSPQRRALVTEGVECSNLYVAFLALAVMRIRTAGELVAITPRSFANGPYFGQFRRYFLDRATLSRIHIFESRSKVFADTGVLQENIVFTAVRRGHPAQVVLSVSKGHDDKVSERAVEYEEVIRPADPQRFIRIMSDAADVITADIMDRQPASLVDLNLTVSTGKVVDFRVRDRLRTELEDSAVPLIYPGNVRGGVIEWPREIRKPQAFLVREPSDSKKFLLPPGHYVIVKRFSAKEERRRVVAAVWEPAEHGEVAFENHVNVLHAAGEGLERDLAVGLSYWLNSSIVDAFFRTFSGHTQVNATDLRSLKYPSGESLKNLGRSHGPQLPSQEEIDTVVEHMIHGEDSTSE